MLFAYIYIYIYIHACIYTFFSKQPVCRVLYIFSVPANGSAVLQNTLKNCIHKHMHTQLPAYMHRTRTH